MSEEFITIKSRDVEAYFAEVMHRLKNPGALMRGIGQELANITHESFYDKRSPDGTPWKKLSVATRIARGREANGGKMHVKSGRHTSAKFTRAYLESGDKILENTRLLMTTVRHESTDTQAKLMVGPHMSKVGIHQFGGMAGRGRKVFIPARPFMPIEGSADNMDLMPKAGNRILEMMRDFVTRNT